MAASGRIGRLGIDDDCDDHVGVGFGVRMAALWLWYLSWLYSNDVILLLFFLLSAQKVRDDRVVPANDNYNEKKK